MDLGLEGRWALITGASQGIGEGLAATFASEGVNLHLAARNGERLHNIAERLRNEAGVAVEVHVTDLTEAGSAEALCDAVNDIDILVNNAGAIPAGSLDAIDEKAWREGWELKVFGYINLTRAVYGRMRARGRGVIINNIGNAGEVFDPAYVAGTTGNASLMAFTRAMGGKSLDDGIRVVGVNPGPVDTERIHKMLKQRARDLFDDESRWRELMKSYPLGRPATVPELVDLIVFLASDRSGYTSGTIIAVDGGISSRHSII